MPPFANGRSSRGVSRGRGSTRGRRGITGRGGLPVKGGDKSVFYSTRVEEEVGSDAGTSESSRDFDHDGADAAIDERSSDSEDEQANRAAVKSHNSLLEALNANVQRGPPQRKKRKTNQEEPNEDITGNENYQTETANDASIDYESDKSEDASADEDRDSAEAAEQNDPFSTQIADVEETQLAQKIKDVKEGRYHMATSTLQSGLLCLSKIPQSSNLHNNLFVAMSQGIEDMFLKQKLRVPAGKLLGDFNSLHRDLSSSLYNYKDILLSERTPSNADDLRKLTCIHVLNHLYKTRDRVIKNNARMAKDNLEDEVEFRDQGFTRPKVLVVLPTRDSCVKYIDSLAAFCEPEQQENRTRFQDSYARVADDVSDVKPQDFGELFAGNDDDMFRLGMKFTRKTMKYFSQFYSSDIIFASPLGLRMAIGAENDKKRDYDFLSSIEILVVDQADALSMQNWEHVEYIFEHLNLQPREAHDCDFSRVRSWYLDGNAKHIRQTLLFSAFNFPALNRLYLKHMLNVAGKVKVSKQHDGAMLELGLSLKQTFSRFDCTSPATEPDDRFKYFTTVLIPILTKQLDRSLGGRQGFLVFLPSYADFVRVRNYLSTSATTQGISFGSISEYTSVREVARARSHFFTGRHSVLLYTERAHHFRRYHLRGVRRVIMYGLPEHPIFYKEIVGDYLGSSVAEGKIDINEASVRNVFSKLDLLKLERIVGTKRVPLLLKDKGGDTFDFV